MTFRYARHTDNLEILEDFYTTILGLEKLGGFKDHDGYNGVFLGLPDRDWHLEFTQSNEKAIHTPDPDDLLVFYTQTEEEFIEIKKRIEDNRIELRISKNPYWRKHGIEIEDPDGFGVVICRSIAKY